MRMKQVVELIKVNMIYANPQMIEKKRNKEAEKGTVSKIPAYMSVIGQNVLMLALFLVVFGSMFSRMNLVEYPGMFTSFIATFIGMALLQGFYVIFNLFYDAKDLVHYLPLPFRASEVFTAKLTALVVMMLPYLFPVWVLFLFLGINANQPLLLVVPGSLALFLFLMALVFSFALVLVHFMTKLPIFEKHKQGATTSLYALSSLGMVAAIFFLSNRSNEVMEPTGELFPDSAVIPFLSPFHQLIVNPARLEAWVGLLGWIAAFAVLSYIVIKWVVPGFYQMERVDTGKRKKTPKKQPPTAKSADRKPTTVNQTLFKYHLGLIQDGTLIMQFLSSKLLMPLILIGPTVFNGMVLDDLPLLLWPVFFFAGFVYTFLSLNAISIVGVIISLDRENFLYLKSLPFSMQHYLKGKFWFSFGIELVIPFLLAVVAIFFLKVPLVLGLLFIAGLIIGTLGLSLYYFVRDYRLLDLEWQNLTELFNRGGGTWVQVISIFASVFVGILVVVVVTIALLSLPLMPRIVLSLIVALIPLAFTANLLFRYNKTFWPQFN